VKTPQEPYHTDILRSERGKEGKDRMQERGNWRRENNDGARRKMREKRENDGKEKEKGLIRLCKTYHNN